MSTVRVSEEEEITAWEKELYAQALQLKHRGFRAKYVVASPDAFMKIIKNRAAISADSYYFLGMPLIEGYVRGKSQESIVELAGIECYEL